MNVCSQCGARRLPSGPCPVCSGTGSVRAPTPDTDRYFVGVQCRFQCRSCGRLSPLNRLHLTRSVTCLCCGQEQVFDPDIWRGGLDLAHAVGDLAGPEPEGRQRHPRIAIDAVNPHRDIGTSRVTAEHTESSSATVGGMHQHRSLFLTAFPGHPLCDTCSRPLTAEGHDTLTTRCTACGTSGTWRAPDARLLPMTRTAALLGVRAEADRTDRPEVRVIAGSAEGIACTGCGAPLTLREGERLITCRFCALVSRVPERLQVSPDTEPVATVWWLALSGPSPARDALLFQTPQTAIQAPPAAAPSAARRLQRQLAGLAFPAAALLIVAGFAALSSFLAAA